MSCDGRWSEDADDEDDNDGVPESPDEGLSQSLVDGSVDFSDNEEADDLESSGEVSSQPSVDESVDCSDDKEAYKLRSVVR